jgi:hypothetical protein
MLRQTKELCSTVHVVSGYNSNVIRSIEEEDEKEMSLKCVDERPVHPLS